MFKKLLDRKKNKKRIEEIDAELEDLEEELNNIKEGGGYQKTTEILERGIKRQEERIGKTDAQGTDLDGMKKELKKKKGWLKFLKEGKKD